MQNRQKTTIFANKNKIYMRYPVNITKLSKAYYTDERGVIFAILRASGITPGPAYYHAFRSRESDETCTENAKKIEDNKYIEQLITALKTAKKTPIIIEHNTRKEEITEEDEGNVLQTVSGVREELAKIAGKIDGKDKANVLVQLAKMLPDDTPAEDQRVILYIPFNSECRRCELYNKKV